jgi:hypothetical protein
LRILIEIDLSEEPTRQSEETEQGKRERFVSTANIVPRFILPSAYHQTCLRHPNFHEIRFLARSFKPRFHCNTKGESEQSDQKTALLMRCEGACALDMK